VVPSPVATTEPTGSVPDAMATASPDPTATPLPWEISEPRDVNITWGCDEPQARGSAYGSVCGSDRSDSLFKTTTLILLMSVVNDDEGQPVTTAIRLNGFDADCSWVAPTLDMIQEPVVDSVSVHEGRLIADGRCLGLEWRYVITWNHADNSALTAGTVGPQE
jgi:hypothetical protein